MGIEQRNKEVVVANRSSWIWVTGAMLLALLAGCGGPDFYVVVQDAKGLEKGAPVLWRGTEVGRVSRVEAGAGGVRVDVSLEKAARKTIRADVRAGIEKGALTAGKPVLRLYGGTDASAPILGRGERVLESTVVDQAGLRGVLNSRVLFLGGLAAVALIALLATGGLMRFVSGVVMAGLLVVAGWVAWRQWQRHGKDLVPPSLVQQVNEFANKTIKSPEAIQFLKEAQQDIEELVNKAKGEGGAGFKASREALGKMLDEQIAQMRAAGKEGAAKDLEQLKKNLMGDSPTQTGPSQ